MKKLYGAAILMTVVMAVGMTAIGYAEPVTEGALQARDKDQNPLGDCPLKHTDVSVDISGFIARVTLTQQFANPFHVPIEAVYVFPMPDNGAVDQMTMRIGERVIKGVLKEREEARRIYEQARDAGKAASLLDQERPNIFTQSVANILPGDQIDISISYVEYLKYESGQYEFSFPMTVGPRYNPGQLTGSGTTQVPDARRITPPVTPEGTRAGHDIALQVHLDAGMPLAEIHSELHKVQIERPSENQAVVKLENQKEIPNRDFILKYSVAGKKINDAVLTHADAQGKFFTLILQPPERVAPEEATPKEMVFVIDCSGSMRGFPIEKAKATMKRCIEGMNPKDTFNLISFAGGTGYCFQNAVPNSTENRAKALEYLSRLEGSGGTEMMSAIRAALAGPYPEDRLRVVCFMTDGFIGNDMEIAAEIQKTAANARVFSFGIGNSVNRFLIETMAKAGRGASEIVSLESKSDEAVQRFHERIQNPLLTDVHVEFGGLAVESIYPDPKALPDLFSAQPLVLKGRYTQAGNGDVVIRGRTAKGPFERCIDVTLPEQQAEHDVLAPLWARAKIDDLMAQDWLGIQQGTPKDTVKAEITKLGIAFSLVTHYTSFVAVEEKVINENGQTKRVDVPVEMPDGVSYEGIFGVKGDAAAAGGMACKSMNFFSSMPASAPASVTTQCLEMARDMAPEPPTRLNLKPEPNPEAEPSITPIITPNPKLDPSLQGLAAKLVNGNYTSGNVKVENGVVQVFIRANDLSGEHINVLKSLGVEVVSSSHANQTILAKIRVDDLEKIAALDWVTKIEPPTF